MKFSLLVASVAATYDDKVFYSSQYKGLSASQKMAEIWSNINANHATAAWPGVKLAGIFVEGMSPTFDATGDVFHEGMLGHRQKYIHSVGATAKAKFVPVANEYTGVFGSGCDNALVRLSSAVEPVKGTMVAPGMGLKCLRDGIESANLVSMYSVDGNPEGDWNFFSQNFYNHIKPGVSTATKALSAKFATATDYITEVGLSDWAQHDQHGRAASKAVFPFELVFKPHSQVHTMFSSKFNGNYMQYLEDLTNVPANASIYDVYARDKPSQIGGQLKKIGTLQLNGKLVKSKFGDENLFIRHQYMDDDLKLRPEWKPYTGSYKLGGKCPYEVMLQELNLY
jgi:hypothetical protein